MTAILNSLNRRQYINGFKEELESINVADNSNAKIPALFGELEMLFIAVEKEKGR